MSKVDELIRKGKFKRAVISKDMYEKEFNISGKDLLLDMEECMQDFISESAGN